MAKSFSIDDLNKEMNKVNPLGSSMEVSDYSLIKEYIDSGNYLLNAQLTGSLFKGLPCNRQIQLAGQQGVGKTFLMLNFAREAQKKGHYVVWYDSETAIDKELIQKFGIDPKQMRYEPVSTVQDFRTSITNLTDILISKKRDGLEVPKLFIVLDSLGNLASAKEVDDAMSGSEKADMTRAKIIKSTFRILTTRLGELDSTFVFSNHTYMTQSFIPMETPGGGTGAAYNASIILIMTKAQIKEGAVKTGIVVTSKPQKNRFAKPHPIKFHLSFKGGMNRFVGLEDFVSWERCGIGRGTLDKNGNFTKNDKSPKWAIKHLNTNISSREFFTPEVFTQEVLAKLDPYIQSHFAFTTEDELDDNAMMSDLDSVIESAENEVAPISSSMNGLNSSLSDSEDEDDLSSLL